jgi:hypothetical protein
MSFFLQLSDFERKSVNLFLKFSFFLRHAFITDKVIDHVISFGFTIASFAGQKNMFAVMLPVT